MKLPEYLQPIIQKFSDNNFELYLVGGSVRNLLLKKAVKDYDFTTNATPKEIMNMFPESFYDNQFGTVGVKVDRQTIGRPAQNNEKRNVPTEADTIPTQTIIIEITTFRSESEYKDHRHPTHVTWGNTIEEDLQRRDFTINAIAIKLTKINEITELEALIDPFKGKTDLKNHVIRAVGNPNQRFKEDALRLLRAVRFATQLNFQIEEKTKDAIKEDSALLASISDERIRDELLKILGSEKPYEGIMMLKELNLLQHILPELLEGIGISQSRPGRHHIFDVFTHNVLALKECPSTDPIVRLATLIHDIGKPRVVGEDQNGYIIFYNHEITGSQIAYQICERLKFSKKDRQKICKLIRWHMFTVDEHITDAAIRRFIRKIGVENVKDMIDVRIGDRLGSGISQDRAESWRLKKFKERIEDQLKPAPFSIRDLAIDGTDIMKELKIKPGPVIGKLLQRLFEEVDEDLNKNTKEYLLQQIKVYENMNPTSKDMDPNKKNQQIKKER